LHNLHTPELASGVVDFSLSVSCSQPLELAILDRKSMKQRIAFLYLNTGGGHIAPARTLVRAIEERYPETATPFLFNGFSEKMRMSRFFFVDGYAITSNYFEPGYVLFYRITEYPLSIRFGNYLISLNGERNLARFLREQRITKVVCLHEVLIIMARRAINRVNPSIPLITVVTDPFTAHALWFYEKRATLVVFSEKLRQEAVSRYGFSADRVHLFPFILSRSYERRYTIEEILLARARLGIPSGQKVILIAGGGEGLKGAARLVSAFIKRKRSETLIVVCGKNAMLRRRVTRTVWRNRAENVMVFGFVDFMCDLLNIADCVITKGGASTVMETLAVGKPVIFSTFIRGQELGNVLYAVQNGVGWYIKKTREILDQAEKVLADEILARNISDNAKRLGLRNGLDDLVRFIHDF
jgi:UDP-N-acetylglucosamine:LPS N-acetylglucosamine transferase